ncbi:MAG: adenylosuccinate synthetase [Nitrososphaeria archaeon]|jgi:adenylosuccinate synthase
MTCTVIVGGFFGDEGKGKIVSYLAIKDKPKIAVRGGVGPNAGHTVVYRGIESRLRMLPSALINESTKLMIGAGVLVDPKVLTREIEQFNVDNRVTIDRQCGVIEEKHVEKDRSDAYLKGKIGTTGTGCGPANVERIMRVARLAKDVPSLSKYTGDVSFLVNEAISSGETVHVEGTQGTYISLYHGTYPFVTTKDVTASAICSDIGIGPKAVDSVLIVFKAYVTRVGAGELPGELSEQEAEKRGWLERATVTGRTRRSAPFNFELAKRAVMLNSATQVAVTKFDILFPAAKNLRDFSLLPVDARKMVENIEKEVKVPVSIISTGADAEATIDRRKELGLK